jgi:hypothetical protein
MEIHLQEGSGRSIKRGRPSYFIPFASANGVMDCVQNEEDPEKEQRGCAANVGCGETTLGDWSRMEKQHRSRSDLFSSVLDAWLEAQRMGSSFGYCVLGEEELRFVKNHLEGKRTGQELVCRANGVEALRRFSVSLGLLFSNGMIRGWLTRESGSLPDCVDRQSCGCTVGALAGADARASYLAVLADYGGWVSSSVALGRLSEASLDQVVIRMASIANREGRSWEAAFCVAKLGQGLCASTGVCTCSALRNVCTECLEVQRRQPHFVVAERYDRRGRSGLLWFHGLTDAIDGGSHLLQKREPWLICEQHNRRMSDSYRS